MDTKNKLDKRIQNMFQDPISHNQSNNSIDNQIHQNPNTNPV